MIIVLKVHITSFFIFMYTKNSDIHTYTDTRILKHLAMIDLYL